MKKKISDIYPEIKDCYYVYDTGEVINCLTGNKISLKVETDGYCRVSLMLKTGGTKYIQYHRLLMMAFYPCENMDKKQINHKDGNKLNNDFSNLEWCDARYNLKHALDIGLRDLSFLNGEGTNFATHTEVQALEVINLLKTGLYTDKEIENMTGLSARSFIGKIRRRETWKYLTKDIEIPLGKTKGSTTIP